MGLINGVPQDSIFIRLLFWIYVNDQLEGLFSGVKLFAVELPFSVVFDEEKSATDVNNDLEIIREWVSNEICWIILTLFHHISHCLVSHLSIQLLTHWFCTQQLILVYLHKGSKNHFSKIYISSYLIIIHPKFWNICGVSIFSFNTFYWMFDVSRTASYEIILVHPSICLSIHLSICLPVRLSDCLSLSFLNIGSLVFSDIIHDDSWP